MLSLDALVDLVHALRAKGYDVGTQECLAASRLLLALDERGALPADAAQYSSLLAPVFCSSRTEQVAFQGDYAAWWKRRQQRVPSPEHAPAPGLQGEGQATGPVVDDKPSPAKPGPRWPRGRVGALLLLLLTLVAVGTVAGAVWLFGQYRAQSASIAVSGPTAAVVNLGTGCTRCALDRQPDGSFALAYRRRDLPITLVANGDNLCPATASLEATASAFSVAAEQRQLTMLLQPPPCDAGPKEDVRPAASALPSVIATQLADTPPVPDVRWQAGAAALPALAGLVALLALGWRTRLALSSAERAQPPALKNLRLGLAGFDLFDRATLRRIAQEFRRHRPRATTELDAPATVAATVARGGLFTPVLHQRKALPEYLALIDQAGARDHQARWAQELVDQLAVGGVAVDRYFFNRDPRQVQTAFDKPSRTRVADLLVQHHEHVLLVFGSGEGFFDPVSHDPQPWLQAFAGWDRRVLVTPLPQSRWGWRESALRGLGFVIAPADLGGLQMIASMAEVFRNPGSPPRTFPAALRDGDPRWLERGAPPEQELTRLAGQLKWYLGPPGYQWLCALALYPQLQWEITLSIGQRLLDDDAQLRMRLADLVQLPWFRQGQMPQWLRLRLVADLSPDIETQARLAYAQLLDSTGAAAGFFLQVGSDSASTPRLQRILNAWRQWRQRARQHNEARRSHPDSPLRDYAFVSFMRGKKPAQLEMQAPASWSRLFERGWLPSARLSMAAAGLAALCGALAWWGAGQTLTRPMDIVALHLPQGGSLFVRARDQPSLYLDADSTRATSAAVKSAPVNPAKLLELYARADSRASLVTTADGQWSVLVDAQGLLTRTGKGLTGTIDTGGAVDPQQLLLAPNGRRAMWPGPSPSSWLAAWSADDVLTDRWGGPQSPSGVQALGRDHLALVGVDPMEFETYALDAAPGTATLAHSARLSAGVTALAFSADGRWLAAGDGSGAIYQWRVDDLQAAPQVLGSTGSAVRQLAYSPDSTLLASGSDSGAVHLLDPAAATPGATLALPTEPARGAVVALTFQADRQRLAAATSLGRLMVWTLSPPPAPVQAPRPKEVTLAPPNALFQRPAGAASGPDAPARPVAPEPPAAEAAPTPAEIMRAQQQLSALYGLSGVADGQLGPRTMQLLQQFQTEQGLPVSRNLDAATRAALNRLSTAPELAQTNVFTSYRMNGWCCLPGASSSAQKTQQQRPTGPSVQETGADECRRRQGKFAFDRAGAVQICSARDTVQLLGLRNAAGGALTVLAVGNRPQPSSVDLQVDLRVDLASDVTGQLVLKLHHSFGTRGTCVAGGRELATVRYPVSGAVPGSLAIALPDVLPAQMLLTGYLGVSAQLLDGKDRVLAEAPQSAAACLRYDVTTTAQPETCRDGFVTRDAFPGDATCVTLATYLQAKIDNAAAAERVAPEGGNFGPGTCRTGWVWREAGARDRVCVTPEVRAQTQEDNRLAPSRARRPDSAPNQRSGATVRGSG